MNLDKLYTELIEDYYVESNQCMDEVRELLEEMEKLGLVGAFRG